MREIIKQDYIPLMHGTVVRPLSPLWFIIRIGQGIIGAIAIIMILRIAILP